MEKWSGCDVDMKMGEKMMKSLNGGWPIKPLHQRSSKKTQIPNVAEHAPAQMAVRPHCWPPRVGACKCPLKLSPCTPNKPTWPPIRVFDPNGFQLDYFNPYLTIHGPSNVFHKSFNHPKNRRIKPENSKKPRTDPPMNFHPKAPMHESNIVQNSCKAHAK